MATDTFRTPIVSIVVPTHNRPAYLRQAIESVVAQTYTAWELWVVDDGSTDETRAVAQRYVQQDARIHYHHQPQQGVSVARNAGLRRARGRYIAFLDDDDLFLPNKLACQVAYLDAHPDAGLVYSPPDVVDDRLQVLSMSLPTPTCTFAELIDDCVILMHGVLARTSCFKALGGFREDLWIAEDYEMWLRFSRAYAIAFLPERVGLYRKHNTNKTRDFIPGHIEYLRIHAGFLRAGELSVTERRKLTEGTVRVRQLLARSYYQRAAEALQARRYGHAAQAYLHAMSYDPLIGVKIPWGCSKPWLYRLCRPYAALLYCCLGSLMPWRAKMKVANVSH